MKTNSKDKRLRQLLVKYHDKRKAFQYPLSYFVTNILPPGIDLGLLKSSAGGIQVFKSLWFVHANMHRFVKCSTFVLIIYQTQVSKVNFF
jgi:hypothetical protein